MSEPSVQDPSHVAKHSKAVASVDVADVGAKTKTGIVWSVLQVGGRNLLSIGATAALARLVSPDDFGLMGMVSTLTALLLAFADMGLSWATVQRKNLTELQASNLFWLNTFAGLVLWGACIVASPWLADFYGHPELAPATRYLGAGFLLSGMSAQPMALLTRRMQFRESAAIELCSLVAGSATGIAVAIAGHGLWALIAQSLATALARTLLALVLARPPIQLPQRGAGTRSLLSFGGYLAVNGLLIYFARNLDNVVIGKFWGGAELGFYGRAYFLMLLPSTLATSVLTNLMVPSLAAFQDDPQRLGRAYRRAVRLIAFVGSPMSVGLALTGEEMVRVVYGEAWLPCVPMLTWLSIAGLSQPVYNTTGWLFVASGKVGRYLSLTSMNAIVLAATFLLTVKHGAVTVAGGYGVMMGLVLFWPAMEIAHRASGIRLKETLETLAPVAGAVLGMGLCVFLVRTAGLLLGVGWGGMLILKVGSGVIAYLLLTRMLLREMWFEDILPLLPARVSKRLRSALWGAMP